MAAMWIMWFIRRFPARESRCRFCSPEEASRGAVPVHDANLLRSANLAMSRTSARVRAAVSIGSPASSSGASYEHSAPRLWQAGNTQRKMLRTGFLHQQSGRHSHLAAPIASTKRPTTARSR